LFCTVTAGTVVRSVAATGPPYPSRQIAAGPIAGTKLFVPGAQVKAEGGTRYFVFILRI